MLLTIDILKQTKAALFRGFVCALFRELFIVWVEYWSNNCLFNASTWSADPSIGSLQIHKIYTYLEFHIDLKNSFHFTQSTYSFFFSTELSKFSNSYSNALEMKFTYRITYLMWTQFKKLPSEASHSSIVIFNWSRPPMSL